MPDEPTTPTVEEVTETIPEGVCPHGGCKITYRADQTRIVCPREDCDMVFDAEPDDTAPEPPQEPPEPSAPPPEPEAPPEPPAPPSEPPPPISVEEEQEAIGASPSEPPTPPPKGEGAPPASASSEAEPEDVDPPGAGDAATPSEVRRAQAEGAARRRLDPIPRPKGCSTFTHQSREFQWVARGGKGNPYGPGSVSTVIFQIVVDSGDDGIDPVDVAVELRRRINDKKCPDVTSVLQRVSAIIERAGLNRFVRLMEVVKGTKKVRVREEHRGKIVVPDGMVGKRRLERLREEGALA